MRRIHAEESTPVRSQHLHWNKGGQRASYNGLLFGLIVVVRTHRGRLERVYLIIALIGHRHALSQKDYAEDEDRGQEGVEDNPPHVLEKVADMLIASERPNDCGQSAKPDRRRQREHRETEKYLTEVRERLVARIVLNIGIGTERYNGVENGGRCKRTQSARVQRRPRLKYQYQVSESVKNGIEYKQGNRILLPVLRSAAYLVLTPLEQQRRTVT